MLLHQKSGSKDAQRHENGKWQIPAWCFFHAKSCVNTAPALQTVDGRKEVHRCIYLIDQPYQPLADTVSCDFRANQSGWKKQEEHQAEQLGYYVSVYKMITEVFSFSGNQQIVGNPLHVSQNIENNKWCKKRNPVIYWQCQRTEGQIFANLRYPNVNNKICCNCKEQWFCSIIRNEFFYPVFQRQYILPSLPVFPHPFSNVPEDHDGLIQHLFQPVR